MDDITRRLRDHYTETFQRHGKTSEGADWGSDNSKLELRYEKMLATYRPADTSLPIRLLDVGCGYGGLADYAARQNIPLIYTGIDVVAPMLEAARKTFPQSTFIEGDIMDQKISDTFDVVVCNGILTQKLDTPGREMNVYARRLIRRLFELAEVGCVFNIMSSQVNFFANNLYYQSPTDIISWCMAEITPHFRIDHSYPLYEYSVYLYRKPL